MKNRAKETTQRGPIALFARIIADVNSLVKRRVQDVFVNSSKMSVLLRKALQNAIFIKTLAKYTQTVGELLIALNANTSFDAAKNSYKY